MSFVLKPLYNSFYAMSVFRAIGCKRIEYIVIFISCQTLAFGAMKKDYWKYIF